MFDVERKKEVIDHIIAEWTKYLLMAKWKLRYIKANLMKKLYLLGLYIPSAGLFQSLAVNEAVIKVRSTFTNAAVENMENSNLNKISIKQDNW